MMIMVMITMIIIMTIPEVFVYAFYGVDADAKYFIQFSSFTLQKDCREGQLSFSCFISRNTDRSSHFLKFP